MTPDEIRREIDRRLPARGDMAPPATAADYDAELRDASADRLAALVAEAAPRMDRPWGSLTEAERWSLRARNEQARRQNLAAREQAAAAELAREQAKIDAAAAARRAAIAAQLRLASGATLRGAALESAVDAVVAREALAELDRATAEKRREMPIGL